ncbi:MAG TPA: arabinofuranosidase catalytic domain-containing protein [Bacteroidales bacterium]|nr:arabinofuranosidase catalytic domain-containing protein [Bacteroidales bacterium]
MKSKTRFLVILILALALPATMMMVIAMRGSGMKVVPPPRMEGPCDIYAAGGTPCVAAHSSTRALFAAYEGPLYQVMRQSDGKTLNINVVKPIGNDPGGYADATAQDVFCANTYCWITILYDQSGKGNHLHQAPRGGTGSPTVMGGFNSLPLADMAPVTLMGHKVYGIFIEPGMGLRLNDPVGTAVDDQAEGQYWVVNGHHYNSGCCFDYGNAEIDSRNTGPGAMETTYFGNSTSWYYGTGPGPWIMTDQESNVVGCVTDSPTNKYCPDLPIVTHRFVTATADGEPHHWRTMGGNAQDGDLKIMFDGPRVQNSPGRFYDPMRKEGAILLGNGGDNSNSSQGTVYEAAMTAAGTFPSTEINQKIQDNIIAARYDVQRVSLAPASAPWTPPGLQTFSPGSTQNSTVTFTNTTGKTVTDLILSISAPKGWTVTSLGSNESSRKFTNPIPPNASVTATFKVNSGPEAFNGDLLGKASWSENGQIMNETAIEKVRNVNPVKINEFRVSDGSSNITNSFIELYNSGENEVDISNWTLTQHQYQMPVFSSVKIPQGVKLAPHSYYLLGLSTSGLAVPARKGESILYVRSTTGLSVGDEIEIGQGANTEKRKITRVGTAAGVPSGTSTGIRSASADAPPTLWQPLPDGPVITIAKGSKNVPVASVVGFKAGEKMAIGYGATYPVAINKVEKYEVVTVTEVGKPGTQGWLSMDAKAGAKNIKVSPIDNISVGDKIRLDINSKGHGIEWVTVKRVGTGSVRNTFGGPLLAEEDPGTGLDLAAPLKFDHSSNLPFSCRGTGISFEPATAVEHSSNEPILPLGTGISLGEPLSMDHEIDEVILDRKVTSAGYQGMSSPDQWFGGPALSARAGNMVLRDDEGNVVDGLNYGLIVDPWAAEGFQATSGAGESGCRVPIINIGGGQGAPSVNQNISAGRYPDGTDNDSNCRDFVVHNTVTLLAPVTAGSNNIKVANMAGIRNGQMVVIGSGQDRENGIIAAVGTAGGTTLSAATESGTKTLSVASVAGFSTGQSVTIDDGERTETAVIASITSARGRAGTPGSVPGNSITVAAPMAKPHSSGAQVSGSGLYLASPMTRPHETGAQLAISLPTPGESNQF